MIFIVLKVIILAMVINASSPIVRVSTTFGVATDYDCNAYGAGTYNSQQTCTTTNSGALPSTGTNVMIGVGVGVVLIVIALVVLFKGRNRRSKRR